MNLPFNLFDLLLGAVLVLGIVHGRKRGMTGEWVGVLKWLAILLGCAAFYPPVAWLISQLGVFSVASSSLVAYLIGMLLIFSGFSWAEHRMHDRPGGTDFFGRSEYYLGMASGVVRAACILLVTLALLNARSFSPAELQAAEAYQSSAFGSHVFPTLHSVQATVFQKSLTGPWIKQYLGFLLISSTPPRIAQAR